MTLRNKTTVKISTSTVLYNNSKLIAKIIIYVTNVVLIQ